MSTFFADLQAGDKANECCFECGNQSVQWTSISHGLFICLFCSGIHRSFGVHVSFVKSLTMDQWTEEQQRKMTCGGNTRAKVFFIQEGIYDMDKTERYFTKAAKWYRQILTSKAARLPEPPRPYPMGQGHVIDENDKPNKGSSKEAGPTAAAGGFFSMFSDGDLLGNIQAMAGKATDAVNSGTILQDVVSTIKSTGEYVATVAQDPGFMQGVEETLNKGASMGMNVINQISSTATDVIEKGQEAEIFKNIERTIVGTVPEGAPAPTAPSQP